MATHGADLGATARAERRTRDRGFGRAYTETKAGFKTTEFLFTISAVVALIIATYVADADLGADEGWRYASWIVAAYLVSRGLAKLGTREPYTDDSEP
jgi:hypothetical protein